MLAYTDKIRDIADRILRDGTVNMVIGFREGTLPMVSEPCFITKPEEVSSLIWDSNCRINLANYVAHYEGKKLAIATKGCDSRNIVTHITENRINRDQVYIIGIPCTGMIDRNKVYKSVDVEIVKVFEVNDVIEVETVEGDKLVLSKNDILQNNCLLCLHRNPVISDEMIGNSLEERKIVNRYSELHEIEKMEYLDRWNYFKSIFSGCIRCYACRNACPLCYCQTCFVDESSPQWLSKGQDINDIMAFHFLRAYHCAGRCTDCGSCQQACPMGINMRVLTKKLEKTCREQFGWEAGLSVENRPALDTYDVNDPEEFIE